MEDKSIYSVTSKAFGLVAGRMIVESLEDIIMWIIVMFFVVLCTFVSEIRKRMVMNEDLFFMHVILETIGRMITYFSLVVMAVLIDHATEKAYNFDKWSILSVSILECCTIASNLLKPKGYNFNLIAALSVFAKKVFSIDKADTKEIITKNEENHETTDPSDPMDP